MNQMNSLFLTDGYKTSHDKQFPPGTEEVYSGFTARSNKYAPNGCDQIVVFGTQMAFAQIHEHFEHNFFHTGVRNSPLADSKKHMNELKSLSIDSMKQELSLYLNCDYDVSHFEKLYDLGYLPIKVKALEEGTLCPIKVPMLTIRNTHPDFFWLTNYLETIISNLLWKPITSATIAHRYKLILTKWALKTDSGNVPFVDFQAHDFSMRGLDSIDATISSGLGHLTSFKGTDSLPAIWGARKYYHEEGFVAGSVPATEHSVMCAGSKESELETYQRLLSIYPSGILSIVSDTWDLWKVITEILPTLKDEILSRDGKLVIRPDSGDPVDILCGTEFLSSTNSTDENFAFVKKGVIELLWDIFGGTINEQGYKVLDAHIGAIYGDSITLQRAEEICSRLAEKGFASTNVVFGIGSFTYQFNTRDTFGFAMKATYVKINGVGTEIFKDPITDDGIKKSASGLMMVYSENGEIKLLDKCLPEEEDTGLLHTIYENGKLISKVKLTKIREKLNENIL